MLPLLALAAAKLLLHLVTIPLYGPHRDELYLAALGPGPTVDHAPLVPALAWLAREVGFSPAGGARRRSSPGCAWPSRRCRSSPAACSRPEGGTSD